MTGYFQKSFSSVEEAFPGQKWIAMYEKSRESYRAWFLKEGEFNRPSYIQCRTALERYMPELLPM